MYFVGNHVAATAGYTVFNASQMYKYRSSNILRQPYNQQKDQITMRQDASFNVGKNQGQQGDQLSNNEVFDNYQNVNSDKGRYIQERNEKENIDLSQKLQESNKGIDFREKDASGKLKQQNGKLS